jgi:hypothetical protein
MDEYGTMVERLLSRENPRYSGRMVFQRHFIHYESVYYYRQLVNNQVTEVLYWRRFHKKPLIELQGSRIGEY